MSKLSHLEDYLKNHSPLKTGTLIVKDEDKPLDDYSKILPNLYLGNFRAAKNKAFFESKNIKGVLNCTREVDIPNYFRNTGSIEYMRIPVDDSLKIIDINLMTKFLPVAVEYIHKHVSIQKNPMLVHCVAGRERSCICVAAYLVKYKNMTPDQAYVYILKNRPEAFFFGKSINFEKSLEEYAKSLKK